MDQRLVATLLTVGRLSRQEAATALVSAFADVGAERHLLRTAQIGFGDILAQARKGTPQLIGNKPKHMTVVISLADLVEIIQAAATGQSFGEALDAAGFRPVPRTKVVVREGFPAEPLVRKQFSKKPGSE